MAKKNKLKIGILTAHADEPEQKAILNYIIRQANKMDIDVMVFSTIFSPYIDDLIYEYEKSIFDLAFSSTIDGFIVIAESIMNTCIQDMFIDRINAVKNVPIIITGTELEGYVCINTNVAEDAEAVTNHMIEKHGITDIDILTGPSDFSLSNKRIEGYLRALGAHGIEPNQDKQHYGNFWINSGYELADDYITGKKRMPRALVCANDYMAYGVCDRFSESKYIIPNDFTVISCEYSSERIYHSPLLTSFKRSRERMGAEAVKYLYRKFTGRDYDIEEKNTDCLIYGSSCGCKADEALVRKELQKTRDEQKYNMFNIYSQFEQKLTECKTIKDYIDVINHSAYLIRNVSGVYICLYENSRNSFDNISFNSKNSRMNCYYAKGLDEKYFPYFNVPIPFERKELLPREFENVESRAVLYFLPLFFSKKLFGYIALEYSEADGYDTLFRSWLKTAANGLELLRLKSDISYLLMCKRISVFHDMLTGLYNKEGLEHSVSTQKTDENQDILLIMIKTCTFSKSKSAVEQHDKQLALQAVAAAIQNPVAGNDLVCARTGDTDFIMCIFDSENADAGLICRQLRARLINSKSYMHIYGINSFYFSTIKTKPSELTHSLIALEQNIDKQLEHQHRIMETAYYYKLADLRNDIYTNPKKEYPIDTICKELCISKIYFRTRYKELFGISYHQDLIIARILLAKHLLTETVLDISAVSIRCGYQDEKYFSRIFGKKTGYTPKQYRIKYNIITL